MDLPIRSTLFAAMATPKPSKAIDRYSKNHFLDITAELRIKILKHVVKGTQLYIDPLGHNKNDRIAALIINLPSICLVCKLLDFEAKQVLYGHADLIVQSCYFSINYIPAMVRPGLS